MATRTGRSLVAGSLLALAALSAGCGSGAEPSAPTGAAEPPSTPAAQLAGGFAGSGQLRAGDHARTAGGVTSTPLARYSGRVAIAQSGGFLAVAVGGPAGLELRVSKDGELPRPAKGAGTIPIWAEIHVTPDGHGIPVVSYPRCSGKTAGTCDLYEWSSLSHREEPVAGISEPGRAEIDGAVRPDAAVGFVLADAAATMTQLRFDRVPRRGRLVVRSGGPSGPVKSVAEGVTREVTIGYDAIAELQGPCGERRRLLDLTGRETFHQQSACGFNEGIDGVGLAIEDGHLYLADAKHNGGMVVYDHPLSGDGRAVSRATIPEDFEFVDWASIDATSGYAVGNIGSGCEGQWDDDADVQHRCLVTKVTGLRPYR